jgi:hypothetical protein
VPQSKEVAIFRDSEKEWLLINHLEERRKRAMEPLENSILGKGYKNPNWKYH